MTDLSLERRLVEIVPSRRQLSHQQMEFYGFLHITVNTFTGREWGDGTEDPSIFNPEKLDAEQWISSLKAAGMKGAILTCKHHDGFCLWPSSLTSHSVSGSPFRRGEGDLVKEVSLACKKEGLAFGVYLSPWDRNHPAYGTGKAYDDYYVGQLEELLTGYGNIFCVWMDGACGEGKNGKTQTYDWERYYQTIRRLQPDACISVCGPDIRWCGNEAGEARESEWSVVPARLRDAEGIKERSQQSEDESFRQKPIQSDDLDLGSRKVLEHEEDLIWYPAEMDVSIRPGWFYHPEEDDQLRSLENLVHIYDSSAGHNATLLLNVPPNEEGLIHPGDVRRLKELGDYLRKRREYNLAEKACLKLGPEAGVCEEQAPGDFIRTYRWPDSVAVSCIILKEDIRYSQRIESYVITDQDGIEIYRGTTVGYQKIITFDDRIVKGIQIRVEESRMEPKLEFVGIYGSFIPE